MLFKQGSVFRHIFIVRSGAYRIMRRDPSGLLQVREFSLPGEMIGFEGAAAGHYDASAEALVTSTSCAVDVPSLAHLLESEPKMRRRALLMIGAELARANDHVDLLTEASPNVRVATFLSDLAHRYRAVGGQRQPARSAELFLPMSRRDIASFTGLAFETVSRALARLQSHGMLSVHARRITIIDLPRLGRLHHEPFP